MKTLIMLTLILIHTTLGAQPHTIIIEDSLGQHTFQQIPQRVIALNWAVTENLIELDVTPLAMSDVDGYKTWVRQPTLPADLIDVGTRDAPNLELISQLKPDLIIAGGMQRNLLAKLRPIAPVLLFDGFNKDHNNYQAAQHIFLQKAKLFDKQALAEQKLATKHARITELKNQLATHFNHQLPKVTTIRFNNTALAWVFGDNAMPQYALEQLGITPAMPLPATQWGLMQKRITELSVIDNGIVLYFEPFAQRDKLFATPLWQAMPFVRQQRFAAIPATWTYGGPMSVLYLAEAMAEQLLTMTP